MQIRDLSQPITSSVLNESMAKQFGYKLNLEQFNDVQLSDVQNKLRTEMSQFEVNESFDTLHSNPKYQKTRALLDVINQAILERELNEAAKPDFLDMDKDGNKKETMKKAIKDKSKKNESKAMYFATLRQKALDHRVPEGWIESAINRINLGESDQRELVAELTLRYDLKESVASNIVYLSEGEADKAEIIISTKDMVGRITGWLEDVAAMKAEQLLELLDSIRETQGNDVAQQYQDAVKPALEAIYSALETSRQGLNNGLAIITGGQAETMGSTPGGAAPGAPAEMPGAPEAMPPMPGEEPMPGADMGAPGVTDVSREKRESIEYSRRLGMLLNSKKK
jgi:hypothetical protein